MREVYIIISILFLSIFMPMHQAEEAAFIGEGVSIVSLEVIPTVLESGLEGTISVTIENKGAVIARNINVTLIGLDDWGISPQRFQSFASLTPPDPERGLPKGQAEVAEWVVTAPIVATRTPYTFKVRLSYNYSTISEGLVRVVDVSYFRQTGETGGLQSMFTTAGPLSIEVTVPATTVTRGQTNVPITFEITNLGGGRTFLGDPKKAINLDKVRIRAEESLDCGNKEEVRLTLGRGILSCKLKVSQVTTFSDLRFTLKLEYNYFIEQEASITALPAVGLPEVPAEEVEEETTQPAVTKFLPEDKDSWTEKEEFLNNWGDGEISLSDESKVGEKSINVTNEIIAELKFKLVVADAPLNVSEFKTLRFWIKPNLAPEKFNVTLVKTGGKASATYSLAPGAKWEEVIIDLRNPNSLEDTDNIEDVLQDLSFIFFEYVRKGTDGFVQILIDGFHFSTEQK